LGLYDEKNGIAIVTSLSVECVYTMDTCNPVDLSRGQPDGELFAFGCATNGTLMRANCSHPVLEDKDLVSVNCMITEVHSCICFLASLALFVPTFSFLIPDTSLEWMWRASYVF
jgi:hypothetical protein